MADELQIAETWIDNTLTGDATLTGSSLLNGTRIYQGKAPQGATYPLVIYSFAAAREGLKNNNATIIFEYPIYFVKVVTKDTVTNLHEIYARVHTLLHRGEAVVTGGRIISCIRTDSPRKYEEDDGGVLYSYLGANYLIQSRVE